MEFVAAGWLRGGFMSSLYQVDRDADFRDGQQHRCQKVEGTLHPNLGDLEIDCDRTHDKPNDGRHQDGLRAILQ